MSAQKGFIIPLVLLGVTAVLSGIGLIIYFQVYRMQLTPNTSSSVPIATTTAIPITDFDSCLKAGNPVQESYPRRCSANGKSFTEIIEPQVATVSGILDTSLWVKYENTKHGYYLNYPKELVLNNDSEVSVRFDNYELHKGELEEDNLLSISLFVQPLKRDADFKSWISETSISNMPNGTQNSQIKGSINTYQSGPYTGYWYEGGAETLNKKVFLRNKDNVYIFSLNAHAAGGDYKGNANGEKVLDLIIESLKFN